MFNFRKNGAMAQRFRKDERGNTSLMFAVSAVAIIGCMGAALDFSTRTTAYNKSQSIADQIALAAAIYVKDNDVRPETGFTQGDHTAASLGYKYKGWVDGGSENVTVNINYDDQAKEATVTVSGATIPTFMQVLGKHNMDFSASSTVSYLQVDEMQPASIVLVVDNSGSMRWDSETLQLNGMRPPNPQARIDALKEAVSTFRTNLRNRIGNQTAADGHRVLRTGILPYSSYIAPSRHLSERRMVWGFLGVSFRLIAEMKAEGATNSNPPMAVAREWLEDEDKAHRKEAKVHNEDYREPLKFVVFMTDGQNTSGNYDFVADAGTGYFYKQNSGIWYYTTTRWWAARNGYQEGRLELDSDRETIASCNAMKEQGVRIFTVGYALTVGEYYDPLFPDTPAEVTESTRSTAYSLLSSCASSPENFIQVGSGDSLEGAFDQIQNAVVKELIRIKS